MSSPPVEHGLSREPTIEFRGRRKPRKGTRSCWECKRRKMRCTFDRDVHAAICMNCRRRGSKCVSQFSEDLTVEADVVARRQRGLESTDFGQGSFAPAQDVPPTPASTTSYSSRPALSYDFESLSREMCEKLPSESDTAIILQLMPQPTPLAHEMMTMPYTWPSRDKQHHSSRLEDNVDSRTHPVLIARRMLVLASILLHLDRQAHADIVHLSVQPSIMAAELVNNAGNYITAKDDMIGSIEGIDCIMMESVYHANLGNLRRSWVSARKALTIGQLMGLNRLDTQARYEVLDARLSHDPKLLWSRLVFLDRILCLLLGLPQGCSDLGMTSEALLTSTLPMERLERVHCAVASRILERNDFESSTYNHSILRALDRELQLAARNVPSKWWLMPKLDSNSADAYATFEATGRIFAQVLHYNLLNQLHLPYMLRPGTSDRSNDYSRIACVTAAREILMRFSALRSFNDVSSSCRIIDFIALMAAMTLLLAHLDDSGTEDLLAHQYHSDRAMLEQVEENFQATGSLTSDALSARSAGLLGKMLAIKQEDASSSKSRRVSVHKADMTPPRSTSRNDGTLSVHIPYFGVVCIGNPPQSSELPASIRSWAGSSGDVASDTTAHSTENHAGGVGTGATANMETDFYARNDPSSGLLTTMARSVDISTAPVPPPPIGDAVNNPLQHDTYPGMTARMNDWPFQGVDMAFFDNLTRTTADNGNSVPYWAAMGSQSMGSGSL